MIREPSERSDCSPTREPPSPPLPRPPPTPPPPPPPPPSPPPPSWPPQLHSGYPEWPPARLSANPACHYRASKEPGCQHGGNQCRGVCTAGAGIEVKSGIGDERVPYLEPWPTADGRRGRRG
ncbi:hypothetical protein Pmani_011798 [Petrolisthes manimaculis]|uniref:Uncharacterized protein n=1 Tax=Petrolisthes manimaculis TaxID=1843537 RepID=A0AAE1UFA8_9EUCA|nr:hypothetical protein Pmani_011798 [Petrolisthes manimaculis]